MTTAEKAQCVHTMISSDQVSIPASMAKTIAECQEWLEALMKDKPDKEDKKVSKI